MSEFNHFEEFCKFVNGQELLSQKFKDQLILKFGAGQRDAYDRGFAAKVEPPPPEPISPSKLTPKQRKELREIKKSQGFIQAIKRTRELTHGCHLLDAKKYVEKL